MELLKLTLWLLPFFYFFAVTVTWFLFQLIGGRTERISLRLNDRAVIPFIAAMAKGIMPAMIISAAMVAVPGISGAMEKPLVTLGILVSGMFLHRELQLKVEDIRTWNWVVIAFFATFLAGLALVRSNAIG